MNLEQLIKATRTVQVFTPGFKIAPEVLTGALELSLLAPNHRLTFPWQWFWTGPEFRQKLANLSIELKEEKSPLPTEQKEQIKQATLAPCELIILGQKLGNDPFTIKEDYATLACSVQLLALQLREQDLGIKWATGAVTRHAKVYEWLNVHPDTISIEGFLWIGKEAKTPVLKERPALNSILTCIP